MSATKGPVTKSGGVQSVERAFDLLQHIADSGGQTTLSELSEQTPLPLPTIHRLLRTLSMLGYVRQLPNRRYSLGPGLIRLGEVASRQLGSVTMPYLRHLVSELGETANVAVLDVDMVVYIAQVPSPHSMRMFTEVGRRAHTHDTGVGKAMLATLPNEQVESIVTSAGMPTPTPKSLGTYESLVEDLEDIRQRGYSIDEEEQELGVRCFAVAIPDAPTEMAISVSGPTSRVDEDFAQRAVPLLLEAARGISADLAAAGNA
ncbi:IclR family transcriptional regulator [Micrococcoides hystricis]|uniref:IclR family transcriptional regulator n=1 Tax=Micrococcoides hystricis TaxID=1572761 RepID=A0ABV6PDX8_9MICC